HLAMAKIAEGGEPSSPLTGRARFGCGRRQIMHHVPRPGPRAPRESTRPALGLHWSVPGGRAVVGSCGAGRENVWIGPVALGDEAFIGEADEREPPCARLRVFGIEVEQVLAHAKGLGALPVKLTGAVDE